MVKRVSSKRKAQEEAAAPPPAKKWGEDLPIFPLEGDHAPETFRANPRFQEWLAVKKHAHKVYGPEHVQLFRDVLEDAECEWTKTSKYASVSLS